MEVKAVSGRQALYCIHFLSKLYFFLPPIKFGLSELSHWLASTLLSRSMFSADDLSRLNFSWLLVTSFLYAVSYMGSNKYRLKIVLVMLSVLQEIVRLERARERAGAI